MFDKLNVDINKIYPLGHGKMGFAFRITDNYVLKLSSRVGIYEIPMFYRVNDFIFRKKYGELVASISPFAYTDHIDMYDLYGLLSDFDNNGFYLFDGNLGQNVGVVDYEIPDEDKMTVEGVTYFNIPTSKSYEHSKLKLIDQDFIKKVGI